MLLVFQQGDICYPMVDAELIRRRIKGIDLKHIDEIEVDENNLAIKYVLKGVFGTNEPTDEMWDEMVLMDKITPETPPFFIWHTFEDDVTSCLDTTRFVEKLVENNVSCEYHLFNTGPHGMSLATPAVATVPGGYNYNDAIWPILVDLFLKRLGENN